MKKYLIVSGDSFTKGDRMGDRGSWAYHTAKKMGLQLINLADNGMCNEWISNNLLLYLYSNPSILKDSVVMVGWTDFARELIYYNAIYEDKGRDEISFTVTTPVDIHTDYEGGHSSYILDSKIKKYPKIVPPFFGNDMINLHKTYFSILHTKTFLENNNIPYLFFDAVSDNKIYNEANEYYLRTYDGERYVLDFDKIEQMIFFEHYKEQHIVDYIFNKNYISFHNQSIFGWLHINACKGDLSYEEGNAGHTNELGADYISDIIIKEYEKLYN
jgi:hypothetical protein